ncbi:MAG: hypothetical protein WAW86_08230 [Gammaproteobacteria bacterium]
MAKSIERPDWYQDEFYNKQRTPEEWLFEIDKRIKFDKDELNIPFSIRLLTLEEKKQLFLKVIFYNEIENYLSQLDEIPSQPIKHLTASDVFLMEKLLSNSEWYKEHPNREIFESAIEASANGEKLNEKQKIAFNQFHDLPWQSFLRNSSEKTLHPNKYIPYLSGIPLSIDPSYSKQDITKLLNINLTSWVGKLQNIELHFNTWQENKILAVFDLMIWFKMQNLEYTKISLHRLIWPKGRFSLTQDEYVNPENDIEHSIKLMERAINENVRRMLAIMCEARKTNKRTEKA